MFHSYLQGLSTSTGSSGESGFSSSDVSSLYRTLDERDKMEEEKKVADAIARVRRMRLGKTGDKKHSAPAGFPLRKEAWDKKTSKDKNGRVLDEQLDADDVSGFNGVHEYEEFEDVYLSMSSARYQDDDGDDDDDDDDEYCEMASPIPEQAAASSVTGDDGLIDKILELERDRDDKVREIANLQRSKLEAEHRAREATRKALDVSRKARAAVRSSQQHKQAWYSDSLSDGLSDDYDQDDEDEEAKRYERESFAENARLIRQVDRENVKSDMEDFVRTSRNQYNLELEASSSPPPLTTRNKQSKNQKFNGAKSALSDFSGLNLSIRDKKMLLLAREEIAKRREEDEHLAFRFHAKSVPTSTLLPKYQQMQQVARARSLSRKLERKENLEQESKPFRGLELRAQKQAARKKERQQLHDHEDREVTRRNNPDRTSSTKNEILSDRERRERRDERAQRLLQSSRLPPRLEQHALLGPSQHSKRAKAKTAGEHSFKPQILGRVPDFEKSKEQWANVLHRSRQTFKPTKPNVSDLSMFGTQAQERRQAREQRQKAQREKESQAREQEKRRLRRQVSRVQHAASTTRAMVYMTKSEELRLKKCAQEKQRREQEQEREHAAAAIKQRRQAERAQAIRQIVSQSEQARAAQPGYLSLDDATRKARTKAREERETWRLREEELRRIKDDPRPKQASLMDRHAEAIRKSNRREAALARVAASLVPCSNVDSVLSQYELDLIHGNLGEARINAN